MEVATLVLFSIGEGMKIIGIDYSTDKKKRGLAIAGYTENSIVLGYAGLYDEHIVESALKDGEQCLIALDAPLGWPRFLGEELRRHKAGEVITKDANDIFRRYTDIVVKRITGK